MRPSNAMLLTLLAKVANIAAADGDRCRTGDRDRARDCGVRAHGRPGEGKGRQGCARKAKTPNRAIHVGYTRLRGDRGYATYRAPGCRAAGCAEKPSRPDRRRRASNRIPPAPPRPAQGG